MELTFELMDDGYTILRDGVPWITQDNGRFPYPGDTVEQSAKNHILELLNEQKLEPVLSIEEQLQQDIGNMLLESAMDKARIAELEAAQGDMLLEIAMLKMGGSM